MLSSIFRESSEKSLQMIPSSRLSNLAGIGLDNKKRMHRTTVHALGC